MLIGVWSCDLQVKGAGNLIDTLSEVAKGHKEPPFSRTYTFPRTIWSVTFAAEAPAGVAKWLPRETSLEAKKYRTLETTNGLSILAIKDSRIGLDSYKTFNLVESLVILARNYNQTVIFTIHQPRSDSV
ncbi:hypothetical protein BD769DRAFT_1386999 [Suillus cothurnatus]|nr:hypothetical protein BD769DRAFT_1386999 [Suillus cothurnatus]